MLYVSSQPLIQATEIILHSSLRILQNKEQLGALCFTNDSKSSITIFMKMPTTNLPNLQKQTNKSGTYCLSFQFFTQKQTLEDLKNVLNSPLYFLLCTIPEQTRDTTYRWQKVNRGPTSCPLALTVQPMCWSVQSLGWTHRLLTNTLTLVIESNLCLV